MRSSLVILLLSIATQAGAECGNLCDYGWWKTATKADLQGELDDGADVNSRDEDGETPLQLAALSGTSENISVLVSGAI